MRAASPRNWSLRATLIASICALFVVLSLATAAFTIVSMNQYLTHQIDQQLAESLQRPPRDLSDDRQDGRRGGPGNEGLQAVLGPSDWGYATDDTNRRVTLDRAQLDELRSAQDGGHGTDVDLGGSVGSYRVMAGQARLFDGTAVTQVVGLPTNPMNDTIQRMVLLALSTVGAGFLLVLLLGSWLVRRSLLPLQRVAQTATAISEQPLASGHVTVPRVPAAIARRGTEVGEVGNALNQMIDNVETALQARQESETRVRQFVADASHELRTPLASIRGYAELSRREPEQVPASVRHALGRIDSESGRMAALVEDLLLLARLDAGRPLERSHVDLTMLLIDAVSDSHAASPEHVWKLDLPDEPVEVVGDEGRLHQIVANLLANARSHTPVGTTITARIRREGDAVALSVHDNGPGVPAALQDKVFQRFARGDDSRNRAAGSTGLGLSIVAAVAKAHGGEVRLDSTAGDTTFTVVLPAG